MVWNSLRRRMEQLSSTLRTVNDRTKFSCCPVERFKRPPQFLSQYLGIQHDFLYAIFGVRALSFS